MKKLFTSLLSVAVISTAACSGGQNGLPGTATTNSAQNISAGPSQKTPAYSNAPGGGGDGSGNPTGVGGGGGGGTPVCYSVTRGKVHVDCGGDGGTPVAVHPGPMDGQTCNGSTLAIGDNVGAVNGHPETITDINVIASAAGLPFSTANGQLGVDTYTAGWIYLDANGNYWVQSNPAANWSVSVGLSAWFVSFGISAPSVTTPMYAGTTAPTMPSGTTTQRCFTGGANFG